MASVRLIVALSLLLTVTGGCSSLISSKPYVKGQTKGVPYTLPKGIVPVQMFVDTNKGGIGINIEPARITRDTALQTLVAQLNHSPFNNEKITITADPNTGFLKTISTDSDAQLPQIFEEAAKSAARLALQRSRAAVMENKIVIFEGVFDPLRQDDVTRVGTALTAALSRWCGAAENPPPQRSCENTPVTLSVCHPDGTSLSPVEVAIQTAECQDGICVRTIASLLIRIQIGGRLLGSKLVNIPSREVFAVPVPSTILANQDITVEISNGILTKHEFKRDSAILGLVKIPGRILSGVVNGITQSLSDRQSILDKRKDVAESEEALAKALASRKEATQAASLGDVEIDLQASDADGSAKETNYDAATLTVLLGRFESTPSGDLEDCTVE